jgi:hypothetical protein
VLFEKRVPRRILGHREENNMRIEKRIIFNR